MQQKAFTLINRGMNRDLSVSKAGESSAYENHNIRIIARDHDTFLSVTNERGNRLIELNGLDGRYLRISEDEQLRISELDQFRTSTEERGIPGDALVGTLLGWNVLNEYLILFTHEENAELNDRIYRIKYDGSSFYCTLLHEGDLHFSLDHPIESVVYHETDEIQKIYWVDGINVLRFLNFIDDGPYTDTSFDSNRVASLGVKVTIEKDQSGNIRSNGTVQYLLTYYNKHGQETGYIWISDLIYLSPSDVGGAADGTNNNRVTLYINNLDSTFSNFRVYSIVRTALDGQVKAYIVASGSTASGEDVIVDDGAHLTAIDSTQLLYLGSQAAKPNTLTHKDQVLFLGDFESVGRESYRNLEEQIHSMYVQEGNRKGESLCIQFERDNSIEYVDETSAYPYKNQLAQTSSEILSFKGNEKYRFALVFRKADGTMSDAFWIGDAVNPYYPVIENGKIQRIIAKCTLPSDVIEAANDAGFVSVQLMIAEATYADRSIKAQGIVNPTMFNVWNRYKDGLYSYSSWLTRPRNAPYAFKHFYPVHKSTERTGEIDCNYWATRMDPTPYYRIDMSTNPKKYVDEFEGGGDYTHVTVVLGLYYTNSGGYQFKLCVVKGKSNYIDTTNLMGHSFVAEDIPTVKQSRDKLYGINEVVGSDYELTVYDTTTMIIVGHRNAMYADILYLLNEFDVPAWLLPEDTFNTWCDKAAESSRRRKIHFFCTQTPDEVYRVDQGDESSILSQLAALNSTNHWYVISSTDRDQSTSWDYQPSYYKKHLMFVDENIVTLNSPELEYEALSFDNADDLKFRIVGISKITGEQYDYTVEATPGKLPGENLVDDSTLQRILSAPLWNEYGLVEREKEEGSDEDHTAPNDIEDYTSYDYVWGSNVARYWLHMWNRAGKINGYTDYDNNDYSTLKRKTFANLRYAYDTVYCEPYEYESIDDLRVFNYTNSQFVHLTVGDDDRYYNGNVQDSLSLPGSLKYPIIHSFPNTSQENQEDKWSAYLYSSSPVLLEYQSSPHAVISLGSTMDESTGTYTQMILPTLFDSEVIRTGPDVAWSGWMLPWVKNVFSHDYPDLNYYVNQPIMTPPAGLSDGDQYVFIGEIYSDYSGEETDMRYGGTSEAAIKNNRFIVAGPQHDLSALVDNTIIADQGDTYFQRWDCMKTKPFSTGSVNNVIDITSVMLETHINLDGRSDLLRGTKYLASIDTEQFGTINPVYSQKNNFFVRRDLDDDANLDVYHSTITWTLPKTDSAEIDEWTHVTLASTLKLDGDKGPCNALRRFQNSLIAFQDKGISEILFNSRTQLTTTNGVPVEIANSGKVDGKRYITNKYGCTNKWSITEGKAGLYFVDNINKAFCVFSGEGIDNLSSKLGFDVWFRSINTLEAWTPDQFQNLISFYDRVYSDIYLVKGSDDDMACLVYNEKLGMFTSFFDYGYVPMMTNLEDRFISYKKKHLWLQNEGFYGNFFDEPKDFWVQYRITPDPFGDKIWSGFDYRADFYRVLDSDANSVVPEEYIINGDSYESIRDLYLEDKTFDQFCVWDEYQSTGYVDMFNKTSFDKPVTKDFRIWRRTIPRAVKLGTNRHGLDRIRNPWINLNLTKHQNENEMDLMQLHDIVVRYFE